MNYKPGLRIALLATAVFGGQALAATSASTTLNMEIRPIAEISVSGNPGSLIVTSAIAGQAPDPVSDSTTSWNLSNNNGTDSRKLTAKLDADMPTGMTLIINVGAPSGASSIANVDLSGTGSGLAVDVVRSIDTGAVSNLGISYRLSATAQAGVVAASSRTVTLTLTSN